MRQIVLNIIISICIVLCACNKNFDNGCFDKQGEITTEVRALDEFDKLVTWGVFDIFLKQDTTNFIIIETNENLIPYIETNIENNTLNLLDNVNCKWSRKYNISKVTIHFKNISFIKNNETCNIKTIDTITCNYIKIYARSELAEMDFVFNAFRVLYVGSHTTSGRYSFSGRCTEFLVNVYNATEVYAGSFITDTTRIYHNSIGDVTVDVSKKLEVNIQNKGNVFIKQMPEKIIIKEHTGEGKLLLF